ncbi:MAG: hypothetical protein LC100_06185 [Chitinophagales bacterium]|nr:hypothetical protein [Chitinophagales bacterium]
MIIDINKDLCPYQFDIQLDGTTYTMEIRYNNEFDYFTVDLLVGEETIINGEKILYGKELFQSHKHLNVPRDIVVFDASDEQTRAGYEQLGETVFLYMMGEYNAI